VVEEALNSRPDLRTDLRGIYQSRLNDRKRALDRWTWRELRVADLRLAFFALTLLTGFLIYLGRIASPWWLAVPGVIFVSLIFVHEPIRRAADRARRAVEFYDKGLARLDDRWAGQGVKGLEFLNLEHPYAADLDLFGEGSLYERLCTARTRAGEEAIASWLLAPADPETIRARHAAVIELNPDLDLREDLELLGVEVREGIDPTALAAWGVHPRVFTGKAIFAAAIILAILGTLAVIGWIFFETGIGPLLLVVLLDAGFLRLVSGRVAAVLSAVDRRTHDLVLLSELLRRLERAQFQSPILVQLTRSLKTDGIPASAQIRRLARLLHRLDQQRNQVFMPIAFLWHWSVQIAMLIDAWRTQTGPHIGPWLKAVGDLEALCALACYAAENPTYPFPELIDGAASFQAQSLGHPLLARAACVSNDVDLRHPTRVLIVSGSNMSGKSTLMRTIGVNTVLALAGAPVNAAHLVLTPLALGATLRIQDSLQAGRSRFYAEITRVRQMVEIAHGRLPLLFLFDELFNGTNSHDRCVGAQGVVKGLIDLGAIGLVSTHDLTLAQIADKLAPAVLNVHFEDRLEDGKMFFDYRMRPGVVQHSNALALMRAIGLDV
jgi:hypothetical protein